MKPAIVVSVLATLLLSGAALAKQHIVLDGVEMGVHWSDGDSFRVTDGPRKGLKSRIIAFNTLESYGAAHRWGEWTPRELWDIAKRATDFVRSATWECETVEGRDGEPVTDHYGRSLIQCPGLAKELVGRGLAHAFYVDVKETDEDLLRAQAESQKQALGMWAKGVPPVILTSLHSADEPNVDKPYDRVVDTKTGLSRKVFHGATYRTCQEVCVEGACLLYVPFDRRYGKTKEKCLYGDRPAKPAAAPAQPADAPAAGPAVPAAEPGAPRATGEADEEL